MWRYPTFSAYSTARWVVCPGGDWYTPRPRRGIITPLLSLATGSTVACMLALIAHGPTSTLIPKNHSGESSRKTTHSSQNRLLSVASPDCPLMRREGRSLGPPYFYNTC